MQVPELGGGEDRHFCTAGHLSLSQLPAMTLSPESLSVGGPVHRQALFPLAVASTGLVPEKTWTETFEKGVSVPKGCQ